MAVGQSAIQGRKPSASFTALIYELSAAVSRSAMSLLIAFLLWANLHGTSWQA